MKKILPFFILFLASVATLSQNLHVESLTLDENNLKAQINPKLDVNDKKCCVIMISTPNMDDAQRRKLEFKCDMGAEVAGVDFPTGEIELYVSPHLATLIIAHPDLGKISYDVPIDLKEMKTYNMVLMSAKATTIVEESLTANYLVINVEPKDARVFIDEEFVENKNGAVSRLLSVGVEHSLRIEKNLYHPLDTIVMTNASGTVTINKKLKPAFGYIEVNSLPESGAKVIINDKEVGVTPYKSGQMASGEYNVQIVKAMYKQSSKIVRVIDGNTTEVSLAMQPNFAKITLTTDSEAILYLDEKNVGVGRWTGRVLAGSHIIEVKKQYHKDVKRTITVEAAKDQTVVLDNPIPICGSLNITSEPLDATIYLDNKEVGKTPKILTQVLIGNHTIRMEKIGYGPYTKNIYVNEGEMNEVSGELSSMKNITIKTDKKGDIVYIDGTKVGETPYLAKLHYGKHTVRVERSSYYVYKEFEVTSNNNSEIILIYGGKIVVKTDKTGDRIYVDDKYVGETPKTVDVSAGTHKVQVIRKDCESIIKTVDVGSFESVEVSGRMKKNNAKMITIETGSYGDAVYVDGKKVGVTPYQAELDFGTHYIKVERNGISSTASISVNSSCNTNIRINIGGRIKVLTEPGKASVYVDNKLCGNSQQLFDVAVGDHVAKAIWVNGTTATKNVHVESGETMHVTLKSKGNNQNRSSGNKSNNSNNKYKVKTTFMTLDFAYSIAPQASFGLTFGQVKKIGWYASVSTNFKFKAMGAKITCDENGTIYGVKPFYSGDTSKSRLSITGGVLVGVSDNVYLKFGAGYGCRAFAQQTTDGTWIKNKAYSTSGIDLSGGAQFLFCKFNMSANIVTTNFKYAEIKIGLGINF